MSDSNSPIGPDPDGLPAADPHRLTSAVVVVGIDGTEAADLAVRWAAETAARRGRGLHITHGLDLRAMPSAVHGHGVALSPLIDEFRARGTDLVDAARRLAHAVSPELTITTEVSEANPAELLVRHSRTAHLVVLGVTPGVGTLRHLGSTLLAVVAHGRGAVVVARAAGPTRPHRAGPVVVGVDGSAAGEAAVGAAFAEAADRATDLVAVHAWSDLDFGEFAGYDFLDIPDEEMTAAEMALLTQRLAGWHEKFPDVGVTSEVYPSDARTHLMEWSKTAQLIVVGSRGRGGFRGLLFGSTSNSLVQHALCPVMVVHLD
ncbi:universal stress protein [Nocardia sp. NBC_01009]|uniref:universal stress protein n=1 Tax=Nocardia sp. NBC_01009 TaxID=2975996 RepID=UPI003865BF11|nr:universal stress protein [Nocardia sp. NBC_01009]